MPVKIRLMRIGSKKRPFYRVVAVDERKKRTGQYIEALGTYNPLTEPHEIILKKERIDFWLSQGAIPSYGYLRIIKEAPQKLPRKPKREKQSPALSDQPTGNTKTVEMIKESETPGQQESQPGEDSSKEETKNDEPPTQNA